MILKKMVDFCKKSKKVYIYNSKAGKFLSNGACTALTNSDWGLEDYFIMLEESPDGYSTSIIDCLDVDDAIVKAEPLRYRIVIDGDELQPFDIGSNKVVYIKAKYLKIFDEALGFDYCIDGYFKDTIRVWGNFGVQGYICPVRLKQSKLLDFAEKIRSGAEYSYNSGFMAVNEQEELF